MINRSNQRKALKCEIQPHSALICARGNQRRSGSAGADPSTPVILTASASAFSREALPAATTDSMTATQRCLSGKLGARK